MPLVAVLKSGRKGTRSPSPCEQELPLVDAQRLVDCKNGDGSREPGGRGAPGQRCESCPTSTSRESSQKIAQCERSAKPGDWSHRRGRAGIGGTLPRPRPLAPQQNRRSADGKLATPRPQDGAVQNAPVPEAALEPRTRLLLSQRPTLSVIVPLYNEEESVPVLVEEIRTALAASPAWELLLVDDGSRDRTAAVAAELCAADPRVRLLRMARNYGQTQAMQAGFDAAQGDVVVSLDGDLQNDPAEIPRLVAKLDEGFDLVAGYREDRQDDYWTRTFPSAVANRLIRFVTKVPIRDNGCSLKAYRRTTLDRMHLYSDLHRFLPALAAATAGARITELSVNHRARRFGSSKYGASRILKIMADLLTITMISWFRERPFQLFGGAAAVSAAIGIAFLLRSLGLAMSDSTTSRARGCSLRQGCSSSFWRASSGCSD